MSDHDARQVIDGVRQLLPALRERAQKAEDARRVPEESIAALQETGFFRMLQPARHGGLETDPVDFYTAVKLIGSACGSTGWVSTLYLDGNFLVALFPDEVQDEVFADPHARCTATLVPAGRAERDGSGFRVSGKWPFNTGSLHAQWVAEPAVVELEPGQPEVCFFLMRYSEVTVLDDWHVSGLRGTGSNTVVAENVHVPEQRVLRVAEAKFGNHRSAANENRALYRIPPLSYLFTSGGSTMPGLAKAALELFMDKLPGRGPIAYTGYAKRRDAPLTHFQVAEAALRIRSGEGVLIDAVETMDQRAERGTPYAPENQAELWGMVSYATRVFGEAIETLRIASGAHGIFDSEHMQLVCRDAQALMTHAVMMPTTGIEHYGRALCGLDPMTDWL